MPANVRELPARSDGLKPAVTGDRIYGVNATQDDTLAVGLQQLAKTLDPAGNGPMARYLAERDEAARRVLDTEYKQNRNIDEVRLVEMYPQLKGAAPVIHRHLDSLRGGQAGLDFSDAVQQKLHEQRLMGAPPEVVAQFLDNAQAEYFAQNPGLGVDGRESFLKNYSEFKRKTLDATQSAAITRMDQAQADEAAMGARKSIDWYLSSPDYHGDHIQGLKDSFAQHAFQGAVFGQTEEDTAEMWAGALAEKQANDPQMGGDAFRALNESGVQYSQKLRTQIANAASRADADKQRDDAAKFKAQEVSDKQWLADFDNDVVNDIAVRTPPSKLEEKYRERLAQAPASVKDKALKHYVDQLRRANDADGWSASNEDMNLLRQRARGGMTIEELNEYQLSRDQNTEIAKIIGDTKKGSPIMQVFPVKLAFDQLEKLKPFYAEPGDESKYEPGRTEYVDFLRRQYAEYMISLAALRPELLADPEKAGKIAEALYTSMKDELDGKFPRQGDVHAGEQRPGTARPKEGAPQKEVDANAQANRDYWAQKKERDKHEAELSAELRRLSIIGIRYRRDQARHAAAQTGLVKPESTPETDKVFHRESEDGATLDSEYDRGVREASQ